MIVSCQTSLWFFIRSRFLRPLRVSDWFEHFLGHHFIQKVIVSILVMVLKSPWQAFANIMKISFVSCIITVTLGPCPTARPNTVFRTRPQVNNLGIFMQVIFQTPQMFSERVHSRASESCLMLTQQCSSSREITSHGENILLHFWPGYFLSLHDTQNWFA